MNSTATFDPTTKEIVHEVEEKENEAPKDISATVAQFGKNKDGMWSEHVMKPHEKLVSIE